MKIPKIPIDSKISLDIPRFTIDLKLSGYWQNS